MCFAYISSRCLISRDRNLSVKESVVCRETFTYLRKHSAGEVFVCLFLFVCFCLFLFVIVCYCLLLFVIVCFCLFVFVCRKTFTYLRKHSAGEVFFSWTGECFKWKDNRSFCFVLLLNNSVIFTCLKFKLSRRDIYPNLKLIQNAKRVRKVF